MGARRRLEALKHRHRWRKDRNDPEIKHCSCGLTIVPKARLGDVSADCLHLWSVSRDGTAKCSKCGYQARGKDYRKWWKLFKNVDWRTRPYCLNCREPMMEFGQICEECRVRFEPIIT